MHSSNKYSLLLVSIQMTWRDICVWIIYDVTCVNYLQISKPCSFTNIKCNSKYIVILVFDWEWNSYSFIKNLNEDLFNFVTYMSNRHAKNDRLGNHEIRWFSLLIQSSIFWWMHVGRVSIFGVLVKSYSRWCLYL